MLRFILLSVVSVFAAAPWCVQTNFSKQCHYFDVEECKAEASSQGGLCVHNEERQAPTNSTLSNLQSGLSGLGGIGNAIQEHKESEQQIEQMKQQTELIKAQTLAMKMQMQRDSLQYAIDHPGQPNPYVAATATEKEPRSSMGHGIKENGGSVIVLGVVCAIVGVLGIALLFQ